MSDARELLEQDAKVGVYAVVSPDQHGLAAREEVAPRAYAALRAALSALDLAQHIAVDPDYVRDAIADALRGDRNE